MRLLNHLFVGGKTIVRKKVTEARLCNNMLQAAKAKEAIVEKNGCFRLLNRGYEELSMAIANTTYEQTRKMSLKLLCTLCF